MAVAAFVILIADSNQLFDVGFQLSFVAVFGIFWLNQPILEYLPKAKNNFQNFILNVVSVSIAAQIATLPLVIFYFHQWSLISIPANLVVIPISEVIIIFSLAMTFFSSISVDVSWLNWLYDFCVTIVLNLIHFFAEVDSVFYKMIPMTLLEMLVLMIIIYFLRFVVIKPDVKNISKVVYFLLTFIALRMMLNFMAGKTDEVLSHRFFKEKIVSVKNKGKVQFLIPEKTQIEKLQIYLIEPYLTSRRTKDFEIKRISKDVESIEIDGKNYPLK